MARGGGRRAWWWAEERAAVGSRATSRRLAAQGDGAGDRRGKSARKTGTCTTTSGTDFNASSW